MIRTKTTLIVGAGASCELQLPSGPELLDRMAQGFDFNRFGGAQLTRDNTAFLKYLAKMAERPGTTNEALYTATTRLRISAKLGTSIDGIIEQNDDDQLVTLCGKLAIAHFITQGEAKSSLRLTPKTEGELPLQIGDYWLVELGRMITSGVPRSKVEQAFDNLVIVSFNYDRSVEHFMPFALVTAYGMPLKEARRIVAAKLNIVHPYGTIGRLPWQTGEGPDIEWGTENPWNMLNLISQIRTHGELLRDARAFQAVRGAVSKCQRIVFLGFGFHPQNLDLLLDGSMSHNPDVVASFYQMPPPLQTAVLRMLHRKLNLDREDRLLTVDAKCYDVLHDYGMMLES